jgi:16S rRNA (cytosine967-C5)-methyltransferase
MKKIESTLKRLQLKARLLTADFLEYDLWWDGELFDRILLDVPCSATGVIRRHPDIKVHRKITDIQPLLEIQKKMLAQAWKMLKPGGKLIYATCSLFKDENEQQMIEFSSQHIVREYKMPKKFTNLFKQHIKNPSLMGYQIFPGEMGMDGFYFCALEKI